MPEFICNTSPIQYFHQLGRLEILRALTSVLVIPGAVVAELQDGRTAGWDVPDVSPLPWIRVRQPASAAVLPLAADLGRGEAAVLALALESPNPVVLLDDAMARRAAVILGLPLIGTLGFLLEAKRKGLIPVIAPELDALDRLRFRVAPATRHAVLKLAGESP